MVIDINKIIVPVKYSNRSKEELYKRACFLEARITEIEKLISEGKITIPKKSLNKIIKNKNAFSTDVGLT
jgi:hypothetical protein